MGGGGSVVVQKYVIIMLNVKKHRWSLPNPSFVGRRYCIGVHYYILYGRRIFFPSYRSENNTQKYTTSKQLIMTSGTGGGQRTLGGGIEDIAAAVDHIITIIILFLIYSLLTPCGPAVAAAPE